jgi:hypothetical protein
MFYICRYKQLSMEIIERNTGKIEVWIGKSETQYGKYEISGLLKIIGLILLVCVSLWIGSKL